MACLVFGYPPTVAGAASELPAETGAPDSLESPFEHYRSRNWHLGVMASIREAGLDSGEPVWRSDIDSLAFRPPGHIGICVVHRNALRTLMGRTPSPQQSIDFYLMHRASFEAAAQAKLIAKGIQGAENFHLTSRDVRRHLKNSIASREAVG